MTPQLTVSKRIRSTPFTSRNQLNGVKAYTIYNHMLLPTVFRSCEEDYWHLCEHVQVWDVSCERQVQIKGPDASKLVQWMTPRSLNGDNTDRCLYLPLCDETGGMINDPIGMNVDEDTWWLSIADSDVLLWAKGLATGMGLNVEVSEPDVWPLAVQGPKAERLMARVFGDDVQQIRFFRYKRMDYKGHDFIVARSGWSKQGGFEIYVDDAELGCQLWDELFEKGQDLEVRAGCPNGIERIESGLLSYGNDMTQSHTPLQCGLEKYCDLNQNIDSMSLAALRAEQARGVTSRLMGLVARLDSKSIENPCANLPMSEYVSVAGKVVGEITSQCISPRYNAYLGLAMMDVASVDSSIQASSNALTIETEDGMLQVDCVPLPFDLKTIFQTESSAELLA